MTGAHRIGVLGLAARWSSAHARLVLIGWVAAVLLGAGLGAAALHRLSGGPAEPVRGDRLTVLADGVGAGSAGVELLRTDAGVRDVLVPYPGLVFVDLAPGARTRAVIAATRKALGPHVRIGGERTDERAVNGQIRRDLVRSELLVLPLVLGLGLAVDYGLVLAGRFRAELSEGRTVPLAVVRTARTAGRTIAYAGLAVTVALAGLLAFDDPALRALAAAAMAAVLLPLLAAFTLLPALLTLWGRRRARTAAHRAGGPFPRPAFHRADGPLTPSAAHGAGGPLTPSAAHRGAGGRFAVPPLLVGAIVVALLSFAALPLTPARDADASALDVESDQIDELLAGPHPDLRTPGILIVSRTTHAEPAYLTRLRTASPAAGALASSPGMITVIPRDGGDEELVRWLRANPPPYPAYLTGRTAALLDLEDTIRGGLPTAVAFIVAATGVLLFLMAGSMVIPIRAQLLNLLVQSAAFGALLWIFVGFASGDFLQVRQMGAVLALVVLVHAVLVRCLLVPAASTLIGHHDRQAPPRRPLVPPPRTYTPSWNGLSHDVGA